MNTYFTQKNSLCAAALGAMALALLPSCQDEEFGYTAEQIKYAKAYESFFGKLPADKSWDLSSYTNHYRYGEESSNVTRANSVTPTGNQLQNSEKGEYQVKNDYWEVPKKTYDWIKAALKEGKDNRYLGSPFVLQLPDNDFAIIPIFQGKSAIMSELEVKVNGYQITTVWSRSQNIQVKDSKFSSLADNDGWMNIGYYDGYSGYSQSTMKTEGDACLVNDKRDWSKLPMHPSFTDESEAVRSKPIYFRAKDKIGKSDKGFMYLSLHNIDKAWADYTQYNNRWDETNEWTTIGHRLTSINPQGHMLALNVPSQYRPAPSELPDICEDGTKPSQVIFVSCEDANGTGTDHDVNDVAFLIIGYPNAPTIVPTTEVIEKRYMCEDLGGTYDYDFNDIVVDCKQVQKYTVTAEPDELENYDGDVAAGITIKDMVPDGCPVQTVKIAHLCGTIPLQVRIGDFMFPKIKDPVGLSAGNDGKYWTRRDLIEQKYKNLCKGDHAKCACSNHEDYSGNGGVDVSHTNITRADSQYETTEGWNPNEEQIIPCHSWDPDNNNIIIYADWGYLKKMYNHDNVSNDWTSKKENNPFREDSEDFADFANGKKFPVSFPKTGEYPYIIATDVDVPWMKEEQHIPDGWINGDMTARSIGDNGSNHDLIGNSYYMENYPNANGEGYIWSGDVTGLAGSTGVTFAKPSAELAGIEEAYSHQYFLLHVYADVPTGEVGRIGLYSADDWKPLLASDPDGYKTNPLSDRLHPTYIGVDGLQCATIYLTKAQRDEILAKGLVVASLTDGLRIKKVTTARPCLDNTSNNGAGTTDVDAGFIINIAQSECSNGRVMSNESERVASIIKPESGKELTAEEQSKNAAELSRASVPFTTRQFISGTTVTLTAIGNTISETKSYKVTGWVSNNNDIVSSSSSNPLVITYSNATQWGNNDSNIKQVTVYPTFAEATNPQLKYADNETEKTVTLAINGAVTKPYKLYASSLNLTTLLDQFGANNDIVGTSFSIVNGQHVISLEPKTVGETSFILYQKDGTHSDTDYGVSGELKLTVKVVEQLPAAETDLAKWMVFEWNGADADSYIISKPSNEEIQINLKQDVKTDGNHQIFGGTQWGHSRRYIDLPDANWLVAEVNSGNVDFNFNKKVAANPYEGEAITVNASSSYCTVIDNGTVGKKTYIIDLKALRQKFGYVHLVTIAAPWQETANVEWIKVDTQYSDVRAEWDDLIGKSSPEMAKATIDLLASDIYHWNGKDQSATVADQNGTVGTTAEDAALPGGDSDSRPFTYVYYKVPITTAGMNIFGHKDSYPDYFVDLSAATVLVVTLNKENTNSIFFQFNKTGWGDNEVTRISAKDRNYCCVKDEGSTITYVVDLDKIRNEVTKTNYLHLNAITVDWNGANAKAQINSIKVDAKDSQAVTDFLSSSTKYEVHAFCHLTGQGEDNATFGYPTYKINSGSMFTKDGSGNYTLVTSGTINTVNKVYVTAGANITITAPTNDGYNFKWSDGSTDYSRTETINSDFTTYADYSMTIAKETELLAANDDQSGWTSLSGSNYNTTLMEDYNGTAGKNGYGDPNIAYTNYADLNDNTVLKLVLKKSETATIPEFTFNRPEGGDPFKVSEEINSDYLHVNKSYESSNDLTIYYVNLKAINSKDRHVYLHCIKPKWSSDGKKIYLFESPKVKNKTL